MSTLSPNQNRSQQLLGEEAMVAFGRELGAACSQQRVLIFLQGDLGSGKTTLSRGVLQARASVTFPLSADSMSSSIECRLYRTTRMTVTATIAIALANEK